MLESAFDNKKKKLGLIFNPRLAPTDVWTTGHRAILELGPIGSAMLPSSQISLYL